MKKTTLLLLLFTASFLSGLLRADADVDPKTLPPGLHLYVIERQIPGLGQWTPEQLKAASTKSCAVLGTLGPKIRWLHSYVTGDKMYCIYLAPDEKTVLEHAKQGGFPANAVNQVTEIISPRTAE